MSAYYNEIEPFAVQWLRNLMAAKHIAQGEVDERSIVEVQPDDLRGFDQCHFFAGIGGWSYALRLAGVPDSTRVWTGSCPCQPFSVAGAQRGSDDERHLWPAWFRLIGECRPGAIFGEQVAGAAGLAWLDHVCADLEGAGYAAAAANLCAAGVGAPHIRQRLWWVADAERGAAERRRHDMGGPARSVEGEAQERQRIRDDARASIESRGMALTDERQRGSRGAGCGTAYRSRPQPELAGSSAVGVALGDAKIARLEKRDSRRILAQGFAGPIEASASGAWSDLEWIPCRDGKARPTQPGIFPLAHGIPGRVGRLRAYGNAIVPSVAAEFIAAVMECRP